MRSLPNGARPPGTGVVWEPVAFAAVWIALGDHDKALALLGRACADHEAMSDVKIAPEMDPVRADPRYHEILRCANLE